MRIQGAFLVNQEALARCKLSDDQKAQVSARCALRACGSFFFSFTRLTYSTGHIYFRFLTGPYQQLIQQTVPGAKLSPPIQRRSQRTTLAGVGSCDAP